MIKYTNVYREVKETDFFLYIYIGGRGIGKTYSALKGALFDGKTMLYVRRSEVEAKNCTRAYTNPFKAINNKEGVDVVVKPVEDYAIIVDQTDGKEELRGYCVALSTFGKFRGADFSDVDIIIFDEFINTSPVDGLKGKSAEMLFNLIETVNRNRELEGNEAVKVVLLSNANTINDDIIRTLNLATEVMKMKIDDRHVYSDHERGILLKLLENNEVKDEKSRTALYKLTKGTTFEAMALDNDFTKDYFMDIGKVNYRELQPLVSYEHITFYKHKSRSILFASTRKANCDSYTYQTKQQFRKLYGFMLMSTIERGEMFYLNYTIKLDVLDIFR